MLNNIVSQVESEVRSYVRSFPAVFTSAKGSTLTDETGKTYVDFLAGAGTLNYGHNHPAVQKALIEYLQSDGIMHGLDLATGAKVDFLEGFQEIILKPRHMDYKCQFTGPTGANSVEAAIKLARKIKKRTNIIAFTNAYHGHSLGALSLTGNNFYHSEYYGSNNNVTHLPFFGYMDGLDTADLLEKLLCDNSSGMRKPAAIILETIQCEGGVKVASIEWLKRVEKICHNHDVLLIVDDIQVGNGRTGDFFSFEEAGLYPDIVCLSKSLGGGLPISMTLMKRELDIWKPGEHTGTFRGNNLAFVSALTLLDHWRSPKLKNEIAEKSNIIKESLTAMHSKYFSGNPLCARGRGMVWGLDVENGELAGGITRQCFNDGLVIETAGASGEVIKLLPPLTIDVNTLSSGLEILENAVKISS